jgi:hypothetical protein
MSLPVFDPQTHLFGWQARSSEVFSESDRYRLFASQIYPLLVEARAQLGACYCLSNGRPAVEPLLVLGVGVWQFLKRVPPAGGGAGQVPSGLEACLGPGAGRGGV